MISNKYGFDYFIQRAEVFNEMARPSPLTQMGEHGVVGKQLLDQVEKIMMRGNIENSEGNLVPGLPTNVRKNRVLRYFLYCLNEGEDMEDSDEVEESDGTFTKSKDGIVNLSKKLLNIPLEDKAKDYGYNTSDALYRAAIMKSIENNPQLVLSQEFRDKVLNQTFIADHMGHSRVATHSSYSINKAKEQEDKHGGMGIEDIHAAQMDIKDVLSNIHRAMAYKRRKTSKNPQAQPETGGVVNDYTQNITNILKTLDELSIFKKVLDRITSLEVDMGTSDNDQRGIFRKAVQFNEMLQKPLSDAEIASLAILPRDKTGNTLIEDLIEQFSDLKDTGIPIEEFQSEIQDIMSYTPKETHPILNLILNDVTRSEDAHSEYPGYDSEVLAQYITTPELKEAFDRYYDWYINDIQNKIEITKEKLEYSKSGYEDYQGMIPELRRNYAKFLDKWRKHNEGKQKTYANSLRYSEDDDDGFIARKKYGEITPPTDMVQNYRESYVMNYMTEQVSKDRFVPKGQFKDRGFKKPINYWQGR